MKRPKQLSATFVKTVKRLGRYGDGRGGHGLSLLVKPTTTGRLSKTWTQRLRIHGRAVNIGLGSYHRDAGGSTEEGARQPPNHRQGGRSARGRKAGRPRSRQPSAGKDIKTAT